IRNIVQTSDQVCRILNKDISKMPYPYSFYGLCPAGFTHYIPPMGDNSRSDNRFYPCSIDIRTKYNWIIQFLLHGYTDDELVEYNINTDAEYDKYSGIIVEKYTKVGANIRANIDGKYRNVKIIDKYKTHGRGSDNNKVIYKVFNNSEDVFNETIYE